MTIHGYVLGDGAWLQFLFCLPHRGSAAPSWQAGRRGGFFCRLPRRVWLKGAAGAVPEGPSRHPALPDGVTLLPGGFANFLASFSGHKSVHFTTEVFAGPGSV